MTESDLRELATAIIVGTSSTVADETTIIFEMLYDWHDGREIELSEADADALADRLTDLLHRAEISVRFAPKE